VGKNEIKRGLIGIVQNKKQITKNYCEIRYSIGGRQVKPGDSMTLEGKETINNSKKKKKRKDTLKVLGWDFVG